MSGPKTTSEIHAQGWIPDGRGGFRKPSKHSLADNFVDIGDGHRYVKDESDLHEQIFAECRKRQWIAFHGSMAERTHRTEGEPDFLILCQGGRQLLVECKSRKGKLSPAQLAIKTWASQLGHTVHVVRSFEEFLIIADQPTGGSQ